MAPAAIEAVRSVAKKHRMSDRPAMLSRAARAYAKEVMGSRRRAIEFLKKAGIIDRLDILARPYR